VLQVGHLERFNPVIIGAEASLGVPRFIECHRLAPFRERGTDVNVVLDLMIHDLDLVQSIVASEIVALDAIGTPVFPLRSISPTPASASPMAAWPMPRPAV